MAAPVLSVCPQGFPGTDTALANLARTSGLSRHVSLASAAPDGPEFRFIETLLQSEPPRLLLLGGWNPAYEEFLQVRPAPIGVYWTSSAAQTAMGSETSALHAILRDDRIRHVFFQSPELATAFRDRAGVARLPSTLAFQAAKGRRTSPGVPRVTFFFAAAEAGRKNVLNTLLALADLGVAFRLVLNGLSADPFYRSVLERLRIPFEERGWMPRPEYEEAVAGATLGLQPSFAESFSYVAAEHLAAGVPVVASNMVPVVARLPLEVRRELIVSNPESVAEIRDRILRLLRRPKVGQELGRRARRSVRAAARRDALESRAVLMEALKGRVGRERVRKEEKR